MLSARLAALAARIRPGSRLADVGTDHAYLPIFAVREHICPGAIATDIRSGPVAAAAAHVAAAGLSDCISVRQGDGLQTVSPDEADDIVIAGMGGEQIAAILNAAPFVKNSRYRLLLQPMSRAEKLREYLLTNGFVLEYEEIVCEGDRLYSILQATFADTPPVTDPAAYYIGALPASGNDRYWQQLCARLEQRTQGLASGSGDVKEIEDQRRLLTRIHTYWQEGRTL